MPPVSGSAPRWSDVDDATFAGVRALREGGENSDHRPEAAAHVGHLEAGRLRRTIGRPLETEDARARQVVDVVAGAHRERAGLSVARQRADHEARILFEERRV
jgi:hypothetical protein